MKSSELVGLGVPRDCIRAAIDTGVYKNILDVMNYQTDLVDIVVRFDPKLVKISDDGKSED